VQSLLFIRRNREIIIILAAFTVGINAFGMVPDLTIPDKEPDTWYFVQPYVFDCNVFEFPDIGSGLQRNPLKWWLNCLSFQLTDNYKLIPGLFGIAIMPLVYLLGGTITNDRFIGLVALVSFTVNPLYTDWATQGTYDQVWAFFFVLSLIFLFKKHDGISVASLVISISAKAMAGLMLPVYLYTMYQQGKNKKHLIATLGIFVTASIIGMILLEINFVGNSIGFFPERWDEAVFRNISLFWQIIPILALMIVINRNFIPKQKMPNQKIVSLWMLAFFMINPFVYFFTLQDTYSYRYVPLAAFMSVFIGMTLVNTGNWFIERKLGLHQKQSSHSQLSSKSS
jgi:hypothetical protein